MKDAVPYAVPVLHPFPAREEGMLLSLNDDQWEMCRCARQDVQAWERVRVPSMQISPQQVLTYRRQLCIPRDWAGRKIYLRLDGANCFTRVYLDGEFVMDHDGGFVSWDCGLERAVPGQMHELVLEIEARPREVSPFHLGGLMRDVTLYSLPATCLARLHVDTVFDSCWRHAELRLTAMTEGDARVGFSLLDPEGEYLPLGDLACADSEDAQATFAVVEPRKWDSEHPWLYTLRAEVYDASGKRAELVEKPFGFRQIDRRGTEVLINGQPIKLRGVNRHDVHPEMQRAITHELVEEDVRLFKEANINFIRTSHYPPRPDFLDLCDRYGIYVEDESAVAFLGPGKASDPDLERAFMQPFTEVVERDMDHPCVIIWSLANESYWGSHHAKMLEYARWRTPRHLTIYSYPMTQMEDDPQTDLWSAHYDRWDYELNRLSECFRRSDSYAPARPVLHDECTHIPCYNTAELRRDPGVSDFWGETLWRFWDRIWETKGSLGCAIWCGVDDVVIREGKLQGHPWGIIDGWRRKKPEYWHVHKGYSPLKLLGEPQEVENGILLRVRNRFNHTHLQEIRVLWRCGGREGEAAFAPAQPGEESQVILPVSLKEGAEVVFMDAWGWQVDEIRLEQTLKEPLPQLCGAPDMLEEDGAIKLRGEDFALCFSKETGLILSGTAGGAPVLAGGPLLHLTGLHLAPWHKEYLRVEKTDDCAVVTLEGGYGPVKVRFVIRVDRCGLMKTACTVLDMPYASPRRIAISGSITGHDGGYHEVGIAFLASPQLQELHWQRQGLWSVYPQWHTGRNAGMARRHHPMGEFANGMQPQGEWKDDERDWVVHGPLDTGLRGMRDFAASREGILQAALTSEEAEWLLLSDGHSAVRMEVQPRKEDVILPGSPCLTYTGAWQQLDNRWRTPAGYEMISKEKGASCRCDFEGTGIAWLTSQDFSCGKARVYLDGELAAQSVDLGLSGMGKNPRGKHRQYGQRLFAVEGLAPGRHSLVIEVCGEPAAESYNAYVAIDHFLVLGHGAGDTKFIIDREINFPELSWACYSKPPILVESGYEMECTTWIRRKERMER